MGDDTPQNTSQTQTAQSKPATPKASGAGQNASGKQFDIPDFVHANFPELIPMILQSESMSDEERQYWFAILPVMTEDQVQKLREILENEKRQLQKLDDQYKTELKTINEKHLLQWRDFETKEKRKKLQKTEAKEESAEAQKEAQLLKELENI